jgi:mono/diheme cytochrome c family protein
MGYEDGAEGRKEHSVMSGAKVGVLVILAGLLGGVGCTLFEDEHVAKGRELFGHYCLHCHGPKGLGDGFNAANMDPRPRDLSDRDEKFLTTMSDQEVFEVISRDMQSQEEFEKLYGEDTEKLFVPPVMPTFKYTLSDEERWALVAFVRMLHGMKANVDLVALRREREEKVKEADAKLEEAQKALAAAQKASEEKGIADPEFNKEEEAVSRAAQELAQTKQALEQFSKRPSLQAIPRPTLASAPADLGRLAENGKQLFSEKYGCQSCHAIGGSGGIVGPALDRAGFRLNGTWVYRWIRNPQAMKPETRMPNLGINDPDALAMTAYLGTLRAGPASSAADAGPQAASAK